jgi:NagD protein
LTLSGVSKREDLQKYPFSPDMVVNSVADLNLDELLSEPSPEKTEPTLQNYQ